MICTVVGIAVTAFDFAEETQPRVTRAALNRVPTVQRTAAATQVAAQTTEPTRALAAPARATATAGPIATASPTPTLAPELDPATAPPPVVLSGTGDTTTELVLLESSLVISQIKHEGSGYFGVTLREGATGVPVDLLANSFGPYEGAHVAEVEPGEYFYEVSADGPWTITSMAPAHNVLQDTGPFSFSGDGNAAPPLFVLREGAASFALSHDGNGYLGVDLYDAARGSIVEVIANESGTYEGEVSYDAAAGVYLVGVTAEAPWTVEVSQP